MTEPTNYTDWKSVDIGYGFDSRREVHDMYMTVRRLELKEWLINYKGGKRGFSHMDDISDGLEINNHSGFSFGATVKVVRQVLVDGWYPKYKKSNSEKTAEQHLLSSTF